MTHPHPQMSLAEYATWLTTGQGYIRFKQPSHWVAILEDTTFAAEIRTSALLQWLLRCDSAVSLRDFVPNWAQPFIYSSARIATLTGGIPFPLQARDQLFEITLASTLSRVLLLGLRHDTDKQPINSSLRDMRVVNAAAVEDWGTYGPTAYWTRMDFPIGVALKVR